MTRIRASKVRCGGLALVSAAGGAVLVDQEQAWIYLSISACVVLLFTLTMLRVEVRVDGKTVVGTTIFGAPAQGPRSAASIRPLQLGLAGKSEHFIIGGGARRYQLPLLLFSKDDQDRLRRLCE